MAPILPISKPFKRKIDIIPRVVAPIAFKIPISFDFSRTIIVRMARILNPATTKIKNNINAITCLSIITAVRNVFLASSHVCT